MNKEKAITIFIGLLLGAVIAGGYFYWTKFRTIDIIPNRASEPSEQKPDQTAVTNNDPILITLPQDNSSVTADTITIVGLTNPNSQVVIFGNAEEKVITSDNEGKFETTIDLEDGENIISATFVDAEGNLHTESRTITLEIGAS